MTERNSWASDLSCTDSNYCCCCLLLTQVNRMSQEKTHRTRGPASGELSDASAPVCSQLPERTGYRPGGAPVQTLSQDEGDREHTAVHFFFLSMGGEHKNVHLHFGRMSVFSRWCVSLHDLLAEWRAPITAWQILKLIDGVCARSYTRSMQRRTTQTSTRDLCRTALTPAFWAKIWRRGPLTCR